MVMEFYSCIGCGLQVGGTALTETHDIIPSEVIPFLYSNDPPSPSSLVYETLRCQYTQSKRALETLDTYISHLTASIQSLEEQRARAAEQSRLYASIFHPIRRFPPELLTEIFHMCVARDIEGASSDNERFGGLSRLTGSLDTRRAPWVLGQVCRAWREVALSTAGLWTRVDISWDKLEERYSDRWFTLLDHNLGLQLERAREQPLEITYRFSYVRNVEIGEQLLSTLVSKSHARWQDVYLEGWVETLQRLLHPYRGLFPLLRNLQLDMFWKHRQDEDDIYIFDDLPNLERLRLGGSLEPVLHAENQLPWNQVRHYTCRETDYFYPELGEQFRVLSELANVRTCVLDGLVESGDIEFSPTAPLNLRFLHTLILSQVYEDVISVLLKSLSLPALRILRFPSLFDCPKDLIGLLNRSSCRLEELAIGSMHSNVLVALDDLSEVFKAEALQTLHTLGVGEVSSDRKSNKVWNTIFHALHPSPENQRRLVLPNLRRLVLCGPHRIGKTEEILLDMVTARCKTQFGPVGLVSSRLEELVFTGFGLPETREEILEFEMTRSYPLTDDGARKLAELCSKGLTYRVESDSVDSWYDV